MFILKKIIIYMLAILIICFGYYNTVNISGLEILYNIDYYIFNKNESAISIIDIIFELFFNMVINLIVNIVKTYLDRKSVV